MPRKKKLKVDDNIKEKLEYIGLDLDKLPKNLEEYSDINFRTIKGYDEKKYKQYRFVKVEDIEILLSPTNRLDSIKEKYEKAMPLCYYLDNKNEENIIRFTKFMEMLNKVSISEIMAVENEQEKLAKALPFKVKFKGNYLWQIYYQEVSGRYFMLVPTEDSDYSTFFYLLKKKIENKKQDKIFVPISLVDYEEQILKKEEIKDLENYLWLFTKDYPLIYEVYNKKDTAMIAIIGETEVYGKIKSLYRIKLSSQKEAIKFYKLVKALFILQTELPHYFKFETNIDKDASIKFYINNIKVEYETLPEFIMEQYLKSISLKNKVNEDLEELQIKLKNLKEETEKLENDYIAKEKQITTFLECKKTFFGKVKYFFKFGKKTKEGMQSEKREVKSNKKEERPKKRVEKFKLEERNYTLYELEQSYKELEVKEEKAKNIVMDINALKLKNKNLKKKIENASNYIEEINKHKRSIFEFWKYSNKDAVATLDEGEEEEFNVSKLEKTFDYENDFEEFGIKQDKLQRNKLTDPELDACFVATTRLLEILNKVNLKTAENKEISEILKELKTLKVTDIDDEEEEIFDIFGKLKQANNKERTLGNKTHREQPRDLYEILEIKKGSKGIELKKSLEKTIKDINTALEKNKLQEDTYVYIANTQKLEFNTIEAVSLDVENELETYLKEEKIRSKIYLYKIKLPKDTNFIAFSNIIFFDNKNMTLPVGMNLSTKILVDLSKLELEEVSQKEIRKVQFEEENNDFSKIVLKNVEVNELK